MKIPIPNLMQEPIFIGVNTLQKIIHYYESAYQSQELFSRIQIVKGLEMQIGVFDDYFNLLMMGGQMSTSKWAVNGKFLILLITFTTTGCVVWLHCYASYPLEKRKLMDEFFRIIHPFDCY